MMAEEPFPFEGEGPGGGWDIRSMARAIEMLQEDVVNIQVILAAYKEQLEGMTIIQPDQKNYPAMPRNRRNW